ARVGVAQGAFGGFPIDAGVGDADAVFEGRTVGGYVLSPGAAVAFEHCADDGGGLVEALENDVTQDLFLKFVLLIAVGMAAVDQEPRREPGLAQLFLGGGDVHGVVVRSVAAAAQDDVTGFV